MSVHILFGESPAASLRFGFKNEGITEGQFIIYFPTNLAYGPISDLDGKEGIELRGKWIQDHLYHEFFDPFSVEYYIDSFLDCIHSIHEIPPHESIIIWTGENAHEQTGLRFVLHLLRNHPNDIFIINSTHAYNKHCKTPGVTYTFLHTGEVFPEDMVLLWEETNESVTEEEKDSLLQEWRELNKGESILRIWQSSEIKSVEEDYFDRMLVDIASHKKEYMKAARLIGEAIGQIEQYVGDGFYEYRVRHLIQQGIFDYKGKLEGLRNYSIRYRGGK
ncbi:DUF1835 domain-containing protein [Falsibacillus pallidus]|uniref:Uncharacterized protein DUF1835 n=1 Tax=Falsibacillus pallidus TaxID=493781 RepID=A0A370GP45_9BACI|nr:DUF1835 domain-containing protein [Falsibacillus pallidus]RDI45512.1 uncharacterized protein DUF1835 [Falsibacillus pallidus]